MNIRKISWEKSIDIWKKIESENKLLSPYMNVEFLKLFKKTYRLGRKRWNKRLVIYECLVSENVKVLCPLMIDKTDAYIMGDLCATGYLDLIYPDTIKETDFELIITELKSKLEGRKLHFNKLNQSSLLAKYMLKHYEPISTQVCVNIKLPESIDSYYSSLSKSTRQNYRTSKNRMLREGKQWIVDVKMCEKTGSEKKDMMDIYIQREAEREKKKISFLTKYIQSKMNPITLAVSELPNNFNACLWIEGEVAGFLSGIITKDEKTAVIPRLAINSKYAVYCPGTVLIYETIDWLIKNSKVENLDLSRGEEKYKYVMGGEEHFNYDFII